MSSAAAIDQQAARVRGPHEEPDSYRQILKSTAWAGGSSFVNIAIGIARTKLMAMLLGPAGFGLAGLYLSVAGLAQSIAGLGINGSGVRQIAVAAGSGDSLRIACTAAVLRRVSFSLGVAGAVLLILFAVPVSRATFGSDQPALGVCLLSASVFLNLVSAGQRALIQGMRRISDLARMGVVAALLGTAATIPLVYFLRENGVVPSLVAVAAATLITSWWYSHKIDIAAVSPGGAETWRETSALVKLGFAFMASELLMMSSAYIVRIIVRQGAGMEATGFYQAAWTLGGLYVGMILQSMGADFYPRLAAVVHDHAQCNRLVNEQARVSMLLAGPGVLATLTFAPLVIWLFYAPNFGSAVSLLRWISLGIALRVISWPMGFIIMAKGRQNLILLCEASWTLVHLGLAWILVGTIGIDGAGIAFFGSYVFHIGLTYGVVRALSGFRWSADNRHTVLQYLALMAVVFLGCRFLQSTYATVVGALASLLSAVYAARIVVGLTRNIRLPQGV